MTTFDRLAYDLGWEHARHAVRPDAVLMSVDEAVRRGWEAGCGRFAGRTRGASPWARRWLGLRSQAWLRGLHFDALGVTPAYLRQITAPCCPVGREALGEDGEAGVVGRVCDDAAYALGNLATLGRAADAAKTGRDWHEALAQAEAMSARGTAMHEGLAAPAWRRLGVLMSFVTPLAHEEAARIPMHVLPPNRLHLLNPVQGLQALLTRLPARTQGWSRDLCRILAWLPERGTVRDDFQRFFMALLPRAQSAARVADPVRRRWALEDAWQRTEIVQAWQRFALGIDAAQAERLAERVATLDANGTRLLVQPSEQVLDAWSLETHGFEVPGMDVIRPRGSRVEATVKRQFATH